MGTEFQKLPAGKVAPRLMALDLDDSLLKDDLLISDRAVEAIKKAAAQKMSTVRKPS